MSLLRVLCLHDEQSSAALLATQWRHLEEKLAERHGVELVFFNGPITLLTNNNDEKEEARDVPRAWWTKEQRRQQQDDGSGGHQLLVLTDGESIKTVTGLDASLLLLRQIWSSSPFIGMIGVGQGAAMASLLAASVLEPPPLFLVFVDGISLFPDKEQLSTIPALHLVVHDDDDDDDEDAKVETRLDTAIHQKRLLLQQFPGMVAKRTGRCRDDCNVIGRFICDQTNALLQSTNALQQVSLRLALYEAECQAEAAIAQHIAENPPSSLMAVIRPNMVALPNHRHETPLAGAPCPSEFLVARDRRRPNDMAAQRDTIDK